MKVLRWLDRYLEETLLLIMLVAMVIIMGIQVTARYAFSSSLSWSEEITRYLFICSGFLSASFCVKNGVSVKIDQFTNMFPGKIPDILRMVSYVIQLLFFSYLIPFAISYVKAGVASGQVSPAVGIPMYLVQSVTVISFILCDFRLIQKSIYRMGLILGVIEEEKEK